MVVVVVVVRVAVTRLTMEAARKGQLKIKRP